MKLLQVEMETADVQLLFSFYKNVLEMNVTMQHNSFVLTAGYSKIIFKQTIKPATPFYHFAFTIPSNKIMEAKVWLEERVQLLWMQDYQNTVAEFVNWNARSVYFFDAAGNIVELIARLDLNNASAEAFKAIQILSLSEIGLVFAQEIIEAQTLKLVQSEGLSYFSKQTPGPNFKVLGDDEGLLIVVAQNRNWYPTQTTSDVFPIQISLENDGTIRKLIF
ncbi:MAG: glyoxalase [Bacteroidota bacterium]